jgi:alginate O-acetyltransferase complex protein AlgJ
MRRIANGVLVALFLVVISLPLAVNLAGIDGADAAAENRQLAVFPPFERSWRGLADYAEGASAWFEDHFGLRARLVRWYGETRLFWLGVSPTSTVLLGRNGWFYYADDGALEDFTNESLLSAETVAAWRDTVVRAQRWCRTYGVAYVFTVLPDKHAVYPEDFPATVRQLQPMSRMDQVLNAVSDTAAAVDVRPALSHARLRERLYQRTDTHWNDRAAFVAYQEIIRAVRAQDPRVPPPWRRSDFLAEARDVPGMDLARMMGLSHVLRETDLQLIPRRPRLAIATGAPGASSTAAEGRIVTEIPGSTLPRAVIFRDSFTSALAPFLSEHFSRAVYLWQNDFDADAVRRENADVVIQEIVGRHLYTYEPTPSLVPDP